MNVAVIPARGGSKRIPRKNIRPFNGMPMMAHSIACALRSGAFDRVIVSTDDEEIAQVARQCGAEVPFHRPEHLSHDHAGTVPVIVHAIEHLERHAVRPTHVCCIYATAPFMLPDDITAGLSLIESSEWRYVFAATTYGHPIFRSFHRNPGGGLSMCFPEHYESRSQDLQDAWHDAGQFYWGRVDAWVDHAPIFAPTSTVVPIPRWRVHDIDTEEDWLRAEVVWRALREPGASQDAGGAAGPNG